MLRKIVDFFFMNFHFLQQPEKKNLPTTLKENLTVSAAAFYVKDNCLANSD